MFPPRGIPQDIDDETYRRIARSFYVVRMVRLALLVGFLVVFLIGIELSGWPQGAAVVIGIGALALLSLMVATRRSYVRMRQPREEGPASPSPTG